MKPFFGNLPYDIDESEVVRLFAQYGEVINADMVTDHFSGRSKGFAFIEMGSRTEKKYLDIFSARRFDLHQRSTPEP